MEKSKNVIVGVEIFAADGTPLNSAVQGNGVVALEPGETVTIATGAITVIDENTVIQLDGSANPPGAANISSTSSKLVCSAYLIDDAAITLGNFMQLAMIKGIAQKGD